MMPQFEWKHTPEYKAEDWGPRPREWRGPGFWWHALRLAMLAASLAAITFVLWRIA